MTRIALDTNILVYGEGIERARGDKEKIDISRRLLRGLLRAEARPIVAVQVLAELHRVLLVKGGLERRDVASRVRRVREASEVMPTTADGLDAALDLASDHGLQIFDALIMAAAIEGRADLLLSEDFHDGFAWRGLVVANPFGRSSHPRLAQLLSAGA